MKTEYIAVIEVGGEVYKSDQLHLPSVTGWIAENRILLGEKHPGEPWKIYMITFGRLDEKRKKQ